MNLICCLEKSVNHTDIKKELNQGSEASPGHMKDQVPSCDFNNYTCTSTSTYHTQFEG